MFPALKALPQPVWRGALLGDAAGTTILTASLSMQTVAGMWPKPPIGFDGDASVAHKLDPSGPPTAHRRVLGKGSIE
jgi:hypothetical protein